MSVAPPRRPIAVKGQAVPCLKGSSFLLRRAESVGITVTIKSPTLQRGVTRGLRAGPRVRFPGLVLRKTRIYSSMGLKRNYVVDVSTEMSAGIQVKSFMFLGVKTVIYRSNELNSCIALTPSIGLTNTMRVKERYSVNLNAGIVRKVAVTSRIHANTKTILIQSIRRTNAIINIPTQGVGWASAFR